MKSVAVQQIVGSHDLINLAIHIIRNLGDREYAIAVFDKAIDQSSDFTSISRVFDEKVKSVYLAAESSFTDKYDLLQWAEGLIDLFDDRESAEEIFRKMADKFSQPEDRSVFQNREMNRFEAGQDYLKPIRSLTN